MNLWRSRAFLELCDLFGLEEFFRDQPGACEQRPRDRLLELAVPVAAEARHEMQALLGAGRGYIQEARGLDVVGVGVEVAEVSICRVGFGACCFDGGKQ